MFQNDWRKRITLSTFGFLKGGYLDVRIENLKITRESGQAPNEDDMVRVKKQHVQPWRIP